MIRHSALFLLKHPTGSDEEASFLGALAELQTIPGVDAFEIRRETSPKNPYSFAVSIRFAGQAAYDAYNAHELHVRFVETRWVPEVAEFLEHDTAPL